LGRQKLLQHVPHVTIGTRSERLVRGGRRVAARSDADGVNTV